MKRILIMMAAIAGILGLFLAGYALRRQADDPAHLVARLRTAKESDRPELEMRINLARGDAVTPLARAFRDASAGAAFRVRVLDLIFKQYLREQDPVCSDVFAESLRDPSAEVRRAGARGLILYGDSSNHVALTASVTDPDPEVRRSAYSAFLLGGDFRMPAYRIFDLLSHEQRERLARDCRDQAKKESDPDLRLLAQGVVNREVEIRGFDALAAMDSAQVDKAKELLESALALDPQNDQARIRMARYYLAINDEAKALESARSMGMLLQIPRLASAPVIDGDPGDDAWKQAFTTDRFYLTTSRWFARPAQGKSRVYFGHRDGRIYIAMLGYESDLDALAAKIKNRDDPVWQDDCAELVFDPGNTGSENVQFAINSSGVLFDAKNHDTRANFPCEYKARVFPDRGYWAVEFSIDAKALSGSPLTARTIWSLNLFRTRIGGGSEQCSISPCYGRAHRMELFPLVVFTDAAPAGQ